MPCSSTSSASPRSASARETWSVPTISAKTPSVLARADWGSSGANRAATSSMMRQLPVGVGALHGVGRARDLVEEGGRWTAAFAVVAVLRRQVPADDLLERLRR